MRSLGLGDVLVNLVEIVLRLGVRLGDIRLNLGDVVTRLGDVRINLVWLWSELSLQTVEV